MATTTRTDQTTGEPFPHFLIFRFNKEPPDWISAPHPNSEGHLPASKYVNDSLSHDLSALEIPNSVSEGVRSPEVVTSLYKEKRTTFEGSRGRHSVATVNPIYCVLRENREDKFQTEMITDEGEGRHQWKRRASGK